MPVILMCVMDVLRAAHLARDTYANFLVFRSPTVVDFLLRVQSGAGNE